MDRFFISGCQRSGTTMLRLILESHPSIQCFDEAASYDLLVRESKGEGGEFLVKEGYRHLMTEQQIQEVRSYVEDLSNKITCVLPA